MKRTKFSKYNEVLVQDDKICIYNYYVKNFIFLRKNKEIIDFFQGKQFLKFLTENPDICDVLFKYGILIDEERDELIEILEKREAVINTNEALALLIAPTLNCNLSCKYCFQKNINMVFQKNISDGILSFISSKKKLKLLDIRWFGGEPTLKLSSIISLSEKLVSLTQKHNIKYQAEITTNGIILKNIDKSFLERTQIERFQISLDGYRGCAFGQRIYKNGKSANEDILDGIANLIKCGARQVIARVNVDKKHLEEIFKLIDTFKSDSILNNAVMAFDLMMPYGELSQSDVFTEEEFSKVQLELLCYAKKNSLKTVDFFPIQDKYTHCQAETNYYYAIAPDGGLYKCDFDIGDLHYKVGNINDNKTLDIKKARTILNKCKVCKLFPICLGGCMKTNTCPPFSYNIKDRLKYIFFSTKMRSV